MDDAQLRTRADEIAAWDMTVTRAERRDAIVALVDEATANLREMNAALQECCNRKARIERELRAALDENDRLKKRLAAQQQVESFDALTARLYAGHLTPVEFKARLIALRDAGRLDI